MSRNIFYNLLFASILFNYMPVAHGAATISKDLECTEHSPIPNAPDILGSQVGDVCNISSTLLSSSSYGWQARDKTGAGDSGDHIFGTTLSEIIFQYRKRVMEREKLDDNLPTGVAKFNGFGNRENSDAYVVVVGVAKYLDMETNNTKVLGIERTFCAVDPTNSITTGNSFRASLDQRYGTPSLVVTAEDNAKQLEQERSKQLVTDQELTKTLSPSMNYNQKQILENERAKHFLQLDSRIDAMRALGKSIQGLQWTFSNGQTISIMETKNKCGDKGSQFIMFLAMSSDEINYFYSSALSAQKAHDSTRPSSAPVPDL